MDINNSRYIDFKVYEVTKIKDKYGFRVKLIFDDGSEIVQQKAGFNSQREAKKEKLRDKLFTNKRLRNHILH